MPDILFCYAGTGDNGLGFARETEKAIPFKDDVIRIYVRGCHHKDVGNSSISPDLETITTKIREAFSDDPNDPDGVIFDLNFFKQNVGDPDNPDDAICAIHGLSPELLKNFPNGLIPIKRIALMGFSRGAVTCCIEAEKLDDLGLPIHVVADQPVTGELTAKGKLVSECTDLRDCKSIKSVNWYCATYNKKNGFVQNNFYKQMIALFNPKTVANYFLYPFLNHFESARHNFIINHIAHHFAELGFAYKNGSDDILDVRYLDKDLSGRARSEYKKLRELAHVKKNGEIICPDTELTVGEEVEERQQLSRLIFTPPALAQEIFGEKNVSFKKDPFLVEALKDEAATLLVNNLLDFDELIYAQHDQYVALNNLEDSRTFAITALNRFLPLWKNTYAVYAAPSTCGDKDTKVIALKDTVHQDQAQKYYDCLLAAGEKGSQLAAFINLISNHAEYLAHMIELECPRDEDGNPIHSRDRRKLGVVYREAENYLQTMTRSYYDYLHSDKPRPEAFKMLMAQLTQSNAAFDKALAKKRNNHQLGLRLAVNFFLFATGVGLLLNFINLIRRGRWSFETLELTQSQKTSKVLNAYVVNYLNKENQPEHTVAQAPSEPIRPPSVVREAQPGQNNEESMCQEPGSGHLTKAPGRFSIFARHSVCNSVLSSDRDVLTNLAGSEVEMPPCDSKAARSSFASPNPNQRASNVPDQESLESSGFLTKAKEEDAAGDNSFVRYAGGV
ncbi:MAG: hypothetical protein H2069_01335 [Legionella sp.]|nr:hypothetical protein [Legionella sp.]